MAKLSDTPEGLGIDSKSNVYVSLLYMGEIIILKDDGSYHHIAWVPSREEGGREPDRALTHASSNKGFLSKASFRANSGLGPAEAVTFSHRRFRAQ
jgi:hypothetical protein